MADLCRKRSRKSKLVPRDCEDDAMQVASNPVKPKAPMQFDIKVEIESCDEDSFDFTAFNKETDVKPDPENDDLFEAEEHDINQLALSLVGNNSIINDTIKKEVEDTIDDDKNVSPASTLIDKTETVSGKRKRVPNIKDDYVYGLNNADDFEQDVSTLASTMGGSNVKKKKEMAVTKRVAKKNIATVKVKSKEADIKNKMKMWMKLAGSKDEELNEDSPDEEMSIQDEPFAENVVDSSVAKANVESNTEEEFTVKKSNFNVTYSNILNKNSINQLKISEELIMDELDKISGSLTQEVDKILDIEMRNLWGRVRYVPHVLSEPQKKIQAALSSWAIWARQTKNKDPPAMYQCYICEKAWWHFRPFSEHVETHTEDDLKIRTETHCQDCYIIAFHLNTIAKHFHIDENCWRCGNDVYFHSINYSNTTGKNYVCTSCYEGFGNCRLLREHQGKCPKSILQRAEAAKIEGINLSSCNICSYKVLNPENADMCAELNNHLQTYHTVRSDQPIATMLVKTCRLCNRLTPVHHFHNCPKRNSNYECLHCTKRYPSQLALEVHISSTKNNVSCRICKWPLAKQCMEVKHMLRHSKIFTALYKCVTCQENILMMDQQSTKKHKVIWHKQKYDRRRNYFELVLVPEQLIEKMGVQKLEILKSFQNVVYAESETDGSLQLVNLDLSNKKKVSQPPQKSDDSNDDSDDLCIVDDSSQNSVVIELDDDDDDEIADDKLGVLGTHEIPDAETEEAIKNVLGRETDEILVKTENRDSDIEEAEINEELLNFPTSFNMEDVDSEKGYESMLSQVFYTNSREEMIERIKREAKNEGATTANMVLSEDIKKEIDNETVAKKAKRQTKKQVSPKKIPLNSNKLVYHCVKCDLKGSLFFIKKHMQAHKPEIPATANQVFKCSSCSVKFESLNDYCLHLVYHGYDARTCPECMATFSSDMLFEKHIKLRVRSMLTRSQYYAREKPGGPAQLVVQYQCRKCKKEVQTKQKFSHWESHLDIRDHHASLVIPKVEIEDPEKEHSLPEVKVEEDAEAEEEEENPPEEEQNNTGKLFEPEPLAPDMLKNVIAAILIKKNNKECTVCKRVFDRKNDTKRHLIEHLLGDAYLNKYKHNCLKCQICHDGFARSDEYKLHMRAHGGMPVYQCPQCGKTFSDSSNFTKHKKVHLVDGHACRVCDKKFLATASLEKHMEVHKNAPIKCPLCFIECHTEGNFNRHMRCAHKKNPSYRCVICKARFRTLRERWEHDWRAHRERRRAADCPLCGDAFRKLTDLKTHIKTEHGLDVKTVKSLVATVMSPSRKTLNCPLCEVKCPTAIWLASHLIEKHPYKKKGVTATETQLDENVS